MIEDIRLQEYQLNKFTQTALAYFKGQINNQGIQENLKGYELAIYLAEKLQEQGKNVQLEVPCGNTKIDVLADNHAYECKAVKKLRGKKLLKQIKSYKGRYKDVSVFVLADTKVPEGLRSQLKNMDCDIKRADITIAELINRVLNIQMR